MDCILALDKPLKIQIFNDRIWINITIIPAYYDRLDSLIQRIQDDFYALRGNIQRQQFP